MMRRVVLMVLMMCLLVVPAYAEGIPDQPERCTDNKKKRPRK